MSKRSADSSSSSSSDQAEKRSKIESSRDKIRIRYEGDQEWHDEIFVLVRSGNTYLWRETGTLPRPIAYGAAVSTSDGVV